MKIFYAALSLVLSIALIVALAAVPAAAQSNGYYVGDSDGDGELTVLDATRIQRVLAKLYSDPDGSTALRGDTNGDGLDIMDATAVQRYIARFNDGNRVGEFVELQTEPVETTAPTTPSMPPTVDSDELPFIPA